MLMPLAMNTSRMLLDVLWVGPRVLQVGLVFVLLKRGWYRDFPWFFAYTVSELVQLAVMFPLSHQPKGGYPAYFYVGWVFTGVSAAFHFAVIYEIFQHLVKRYEAFRLLGRTLMRWAVVLSALGAVVLAAFAPSSDSIDLLRELITLKISLTAVQWALLFFLMGLAFWFRISWPHGLFGISLGLALYISVELGITAARAQMGMVANPSLYFAETGGYTCAILIWSYYLFQREPIAQIVTAPEADLEKWNQELLRLLQR